MEWAPGPLNLLTDVEGLLVGHASDEDLLSGVTVLTAEAPFVTGVHVMGGAPGTRETDLLAPDKTVEHADAIVLSGGSAFGLDAGSGVCDALRAQGRGFAVGTQHVPIVPGAVIFDLLAGGDTNWSVNPYRDLGVEALARVSAEFALGSEGAGTGATTANLKGGVGSASLKLPSGHMVGAMVVVNSLGSAIVDQGPHFWAAPFEIGDEFGGRGISGDNDAGRMPMTKLNIPSNTTIGIVATDAVLNKAQCTRLAVAAHDGYARALVPSHTAFDGDAVFAVSTGRKPVSDPAVDWVTLGHAAAVCMTRAIGRAVFHAQPRTRDLFPTWQQLFSTD